MPRAMKDVAIIGMACIFPKAPDLQTYWSNICNKVDAITDAPPERLDDAYFNPVSTGPERISVRRGAFIDDYATFDAAGFGIMPVAAEGAEPDQLLALKVATQALADAGFEEKEFPRDRTSVILGRGNYVGPGITRLINHVRVAEQLTQSLRKLLPGIDEGTLEGIKRDFQGHSGAYGPDTAIGLVPNLVASRIANRLDLGGSAYTVDAACSSSLVAVEQACRELTGGEADMALAGGIHLCHDPSFWSVFSQLGALSREETIRPFDRRADGLLIGEGLGMVVLKRQEDAERDGDRIYATIRGIGISSDGRGASLMNPRTGGQLLALQRAWESAGLDPSTVGLVEAHGTATPVGDATELDTLAAFFGPAEAGTPRAGLGSVKSMIGHTMPAAGAAALIKAALAVYHGVLPPTLHCEEPNPELEKTRFRILNDAEPWDAPLRRAAVNAFGFGGINSHLILDAPEETPGVSLPPVPAPASFSEDALLLAAESQEALLAALESGVSARTGDWRLAVFNPTPQRLEAARKAVESGKQRIGRDGIYFSPKGLVAQGGRVAFLFPGLDAVFQHRTEEVAAHFGWEAPPPANNESITSRAVSVFQVNEMMMRVMDELAVKPELIAGHSIGEWSAMVAAGMLDADAVLSVLAGVDPAAFEFPDLGYLATGASSETAAAEMRGLPGLIVSQDNCPHQTVICGPLDELKELGLRLARLGILSEVLPFRSGFHSPEFASFVDEYARQFAKLKLAPARVPLWSATTCTEYPVDADSIRALFREHLLSPVRFRESIESLYLEGVRVFVQVGSGRLTSFVEDILEGKEHIAIPLHVTTRPGMEQLRRAAALMFIQGIDLDLEKIGLATETKPARRQMKLKLGVPLVELTVPPLDLANIGTAPPQEPPSPPAPTSYEETLRFSVDDYPELIDHCLIPQPEHWPVLEDRAPTVPMTMSLELMQELAERAVPGSVAVSVEQLLAKAWLGVEPPVTVVGRVEPLPDGRLRVNLPPYIESTVVTAAAYPSAPAPVELVLVDETVPKLESRRIYRDGWLFHGPAYQGIVRLEAMGRNGMRATLRSLPGKGALLDAAGQVLGLWIMLNCDTDRLAMPVRLRRAAFYGRSPEPGQLVECTVEIKHLSAHEVRADIELVVDGAVYARLEDWEDWRFQTGGGIYEVMRHADRNLLAEPRGEHAVMIENFGWTGATIEYLGNRYLSAAERARGKAKHSQRAYAEWLAGRIAAKDAVRRHLFEHGHGGIFPVELEVFNDPQGCPFVKGPFEADLHLSITHKDNLAAAIVREAAGCGIDIERIEEHSEAFNGLAFNADELAVLPMQSPEWLTRLWSAKEAVSKALGTGMSDPRSLRLSKVEDSNLMVNECWVETQRIGDYILAWTRA